MTTVLLKAGAILAISGAAVMGGYGLYYGFKEEVFESSIPLVIRVAVPATCIGVALLLGAVGWERYRRRKDENLGEVRE